MKLRHAKKYPAVNNRALLSLAKDMQLFYRELKIDVTLTQMNSNLGSFERSASILLGGAALIVGIRRGSVLGWIATAVGVELIRRGVTGAWPFQTPPQTEPKRTARRLQEIVDLASEESFPASDPPAY